MIADTQSVATARVVLLGCGRVGGAVARRLVDPNRPPALQAIELVGVLVRERSRDAASSLQISELAAAGVPVLTSFDALLERRPQVAIETIGGREVPLPFVASLIAHGVPVVTANKSLVAGHGSALARLALEHGSELRAEAAVGAAVPILAALRQRSGDRVRSIRAVLNGTCNFVLERMERAGCSIGEAVSEAHALGLAERDPAADLSGRDTAEKLAVLALIAGFGAGPNGPDAPDPPTAGTIDVDSIPTTGIERLTPTLLREAARRGQAIRLVASLEVHGDQPPWLEVAPVLLDRRHPLASLRGPENAILLDSDPGGPLLLRGLGAGPDATASAILGDVLALAPRVPIRRAAGRGGTAASPAIVRHIAPPPRAHRVRLRTGPCAPEATLSALAAVDVECVAAEFTSAGVDLETAALGADGHAALLKVARGIDPDAAVLAVA